MRKLAILGLAAAALTAGMVLASAPGQAKEWRGWNIHVPDYPVSKAMDAFTDMLAKRSDGRITAKTYHSGVLGTQPDAIEQVRLGGIDFGEFNLGPMGQVVPTADVVSLPFIFKNMDHMHRVMDGPIGDEISAAMAEKGLVALAWYDSGARSFYNSKHPIYTPADLKGMKIRVMNNDLFVGMVEAMGGNATPMAFSEVFQSLKTGVVDGAENNWPSYESTNHFEVAKYYSDTEHLIIPECVCINKGLWDSLSPADQKLVKDAARESAVLQRKLWAERAEDSRKKVEAAGVKFNKVKDKAMFQAAMQPVYDAFLKQHPDLKKLVEEIKATD
ncbi:tripartite ATP-independent transporter solute receptor, DctP family [Tistlia consotensis]|uniref:Tripartite ATP-independent transporter solute receptor, DctP family n=1 Tax=Tistlia consotensis USBA 355 TaxID=560819 RepID=A0A1Y6CLN6_9PROT|nr:TRAP transporter substrate-binding protein [Tistlia consotensis]SMF76023.1 tripartite ATP-independent transporter solute receptor, DctP family [Tistlia consotensis USBA 355]SNS11959.1 tripartite ATP-independent transporter solute receptor, DctP family [Tistlia consotensis]